MFTPSPSRTNVLIRLTPCRNAGKGRLLSARLAAAPTEGALLFRVWDAPAALGLQQLLERRFSRETRLLLPGQDEPERLRTRAWFRGALRPALVLAGDLPAPDERPDVRGFYIMNLPPSLASAAADLGAAGRDGLEATAEFFASASDRERRLAGIPADLPESERRERVEQINLAVAWLEHDGCARAFLADRPGGAAAGVCGHCGWCYGKRGEFLPAE